MYFCLLKNSFLKKKTSCFPLIKQLFKGYCELVGTGSAHPISTCCEQYLPNLLVSKQFIKFSRSFFFLFVVIYLLLLLHFSGSGLGWYLHGGKCLLFWPITYFEATNLMNMLLMCILFSKEWRAACSLCRKDYMFPTHFIYFVLKTLINFNVSLTTCSPVCISSDSTWGANHRV